MNSIHTLIPYPILILYSDLRLHFWSGLPLQDFSAKILYIFIIPPMRITCLTHRILLDMIIPITSHRSRGSLVSIVTSLRVGRPGLKSLREQRGDFFSTPPHSHRHWGSPSLLHNGYRMGLSLGVKRPWREADHSPLSSAEAKNEWRCISILPISLHGLVLN
jgi:hypothetical protein